MSDTKENLEEIEALDEKKDDSEKNSSLASSLYEAVSVVISSIMIIAVIFTFVFRLVGVNGNSMEHTLQNGDWLLVTPYYNEPEYGDIVISTKKTAAQGSLVKRVIAVAGDVVEIDENDTVYVNGKALEESSYAVKSGIRHGNLTYPVTVPEGCVMLMGDNRPKSWDSRYSEIGFAEIDYLLGKAQFRFSSKADIYSNFNK